MTQRYYKEQSRLEWFCDLQDGEHLRIEQVQLGAVLRIADAIELMAKNHSKMGSDLVWYKRRLSEETAAAMRLAHSNSALRGHIKRIKKVAK